MLPLWHHAAAAGWAAVMAFNGLQLQAELLTWPVPQTCGALSR